MTSLAEGYIRIPVWSNDGEIKPLIDDNGRIPIQLVGIDVTLDVNLESSDITLNVSEQSPLTSIESQGYGYNGSAWKKLALLWGYTSRIRENLGGTQSGASPYTKYSTTPVSGKVQVIELITVRDNTRATTATEIGVSDGTTDFVLEQFWTPAQYYVLTFKGRIVLQAGDKVYVSVTGGQNGDVINAVCWGYEMSVD